MFFTLTLLLILPVAASFYYSAERDMLWLCLSVAALVILLYVLMRIVDRVSSVSGRRVLGFTLMSPLVLFELSRLASFYFQGESFNARFFFHFNWNSITEAGAAYLPVFIAVTVYLMLIAWLCWVGFGKTHHYRQGSLPGQLLLVIVAVFLLEPDLSKLSARQMPVLFQVTESLELDAIDWRDLALNPEALSPTVGPVEPGKNLLLIYLESLESVYTDDGIFPGLTPNLNRLKQSGLDFKQMRQTRGTGWTIAGMVASQCGTPLLYRYGTDGNAVLQTGFLSRAICLGDILKQAGYSQVYLGGASTRFAGKGDFLAAHGYDEVLGNTELADWLDDPSYQSGWGLYDDSLFAIAAEKFAALANAQQPFNLTVLTLDTHHPNGHASASCPPYVSNRNTMLDAVHCTDYLLGQFLQSVSRHSAWDNTLVVLLSDHLAMRNVAQPFYPPDGERLLSFIVLNAGAQEAITVPGTHMDVAPTLLHLMGVQHERHFLAGENLIGLERNVSDNTRFSGERQGVLDTLRYLNQSVLTQRMDDGCVQDARITVRNDAIHIGSLSLPMYSADSAVTADALETRYGVLVIFDAHGKAEYTVTFNLANLSHVLYQYGNEPFLLIAKGEYLPSDLKNQFNQPEWNDGIVALWNNAQGAVAFLGGSPTSESLDIRHPGCSNSLAGIENDAVANVAVAELSTICQIDSASESYVDTDTGMLTLPRVAYENVWYQARLSKAGENRYKLADLFLQDEIIPDPQSDRCHAYFANSELIIPAVQIEDAHYAAKMQLDLMQDDHFRIVEIVKR